MDWDRIEGNWKQAKGHIKQQWGKLTDDEIDQMQGNAEILIGRIQEHYGRSREQAEQEVDHWMQEHGRAA
jgi:uncharacterized protein YjbJ (UPF0337 family)